jgi:RNase H-like domain found in reverse transcriptase
MYGAVLMQEKCPITYLNKALGVKHQGLSTYEKELMALFNVVHKWRHYLQNQPFIIKTDHISLKTFWNKDSPILYNIRVFASF